MKTRVILSAALFLLACTVMAQRPPRRNISPARHPNLAAAQKYTAQAYEKIAAAQKANEWDLGGHAQRAKELLLEADKELKLAAETANAR
jgi:outer membrane biogenesis lipoprotein LolB